MEVLRTIFSRSKPKVAQPPKVPTDDVYPVHFFDDTKPFRGMLLNWTLRFDDVLDADKLESSLSRLLEIGDWKKLGGRMRLSPDDKLELHVPECFTPERPAIRFSHDVHDFSIADHPKAKHLPKSTSVPSIQPGVVNFYTLGARPGAPMTLEDLLTSDEPQIHLHVISFTDATVIGLLFSHVLFGAAGMQSLVTNWSLVMAGREAEVPALCGAREDILEDVGVPSDPDKEPFLLDPRRLKGLRHLRFNIRFLWDMWRRPEIASKVLCLPPKFVSDLRARAMADLHAMDEKGALGAEEEAPFVSEGDVLTAWWTRMVCTARGGKRSVTVLNAVDITGRLKSVFAPGKHYVQNFALGTWTVLSSAEVVKAPLGYVAKCIRYDIQTQTTPSQIMAFMRRLREAGRCGDQPVYGKPDSMLIIFTNWSRCKFFECVDFAPAVVPRVDPAAAAAAANRHSATSADGEITATAPQDPEKAAANATATEVPSELAAKKPPPGKLSYHHSLARTRSVLSRNVFTILGKDLSGNVWVSALGHPECWEHLEKYIATSSK
ncbi:lysr family regulatory protein [Colletotrichum kahawae]|uniref:Lysr family regulatory protein n=1 Tax=Colletotrichum kahawae TaxID=34407 RepID=A0AAD9YU47_COLKA|nr:lysr family regulatory protein [Colletotrichum kahawae]